MGKNVFFPRHKTSLQNNIEKMMKFVRFENKGKLNCYNKNYKSYKNWKTKCWMLQKIWFGFKLVTVVYFDWLLNSCAPESWLKSFFSSGLHHYSSFQYFFRWNKIKLKQETFFNIWESFFLVWSHLWDSFSDHLSSSHNTMQPCRHHACPS